MLLCSALTVDIWEGALVTLSGPFFRVPCGLRQEIQVCYGFFWAEGRFSSSERVSWEWAAGKWVAEVAKKSGSSLGWRSRAWQFRAEKASLELQTVALGFGWPLPLSTLTPLSKFSSHLVFKCEMQNQRAGLVQRVCGSSSLSFLS